MVLPPDQNEGGQLDPQQSERIKLAEQVTRFVLAVQELAIQLAQIDQGGRVFEGVFKGEISAKSFVDLVERRAIALEDIDRYLALFADLRQKIKVGKETFDSVDFANPMIPAETQVSLLKVHSIFVSTEALLNEYHQPLFAQLENLTKWYRGRDGDASSN